MIVYQCDLCGEVRDCAPRQVEQMEYDICANCWDALMEQLKGKGRARSGRRHVIEPPALPLIVPEPREPEHPFPGKPPDIIAGIRAN